MDRQTPTRKMLERQSSRAEILKAAVTLFYENGYTGVTVAQIARDAEFGVGKIYRLFPGGKENIYYAIQEMVVEAFEREIAILLNGVTSEIDIIRRYVRAAANVYKTYPRQMSMYLKQVAGAGMDPGYKLPKPLAARYRACASHVEQAFISGEKKGRFKSIPPKTALLVLRAIITDRFLDWYNNGGQAPMEPCIEMIEQFFLTGLTNV